MDLRLAIVLLLLNLKGIYLFSQDSLIGVIGNELYSIDTLDSSISYVATLSPLLNNDTIRNLSYSKSDCRFYSLIKAGHSPTLISINIEGDVNIIGELFLEGEVIYFVEGMAYNNVRNKLYVSASLDGVRSDGDFFSESLLEVDPITLECKLVDRISPGSTFQGDIDNMEFVADSLIAHDGQPGSANRSGIYNMSLVQEKLAPILLSEHFYMPVRDFASNDAFLYFITSDRELFKYNLESHSAILINLTHDRNDFEGNVFSGIDFYSSDNLKSETLDTVLCVGDTLEISLSSELYSDVLWNDGTIGFDIEIVDSDIVWANYYKESCKYVTDTINVKFEYCFNCEACRPCFSYIPNIMRINHSATNNYFKVFFDDDCCFQEFKTLQIYDRWGESIFDSNDNYWDGTFQNRFVESGSFIYVIRWEENRNCENVLIQKIGSLTVLD